MSRILFTQTLWPHSIFFIYSLTSISLQTLTTYVHHIETLNSDHDKHEDSHQPHTTPAVLAPSKDAQMMIKAIDAIVKSNIPSKVKLHEPNAFDSGEVYLHTLMMEVLHEESWLYGIM